MSDYLSNRESGYWTYQIGYRAISLPETEYRSALNTKEYGIVEAFYNAQDELEFVTQEFQYPFGESLEDVVADLLMFKEAIDKPLIDLDNAPYVGINLGD